MRKLIPIALLLFVILSAKAQEYYNDAQVWGTLKLEKHFGKKFSVYLSEKVRVTQDVSDLSRGGTFIGLKYKFNKYINILGGYAYVQKRKNQPYYDTRH